MSNGKFFSGLTERMMTRSGGPNRQQSSLFWTEDEEVNQTKPIRKTQTPTKIEDDPNQWKTTQQNDRSRQQTPTNDTFNPKSSSRQCEQVDKYHRKNQGLTSKIEFYDYPDGNTKVTKTEKSYTPNNEHGRKRISFNENKEMQTKQEKDMNEIETKTKQMMSERGNETEKNTFLDDNPFNQDWDETRTNRKYRVEPDTFRKKNYNHSPSNNVDGSNTRRIPITLTQEDDRSDNRGQSNLQINSNNMKKSSIFNDYNNDEYYNKRSGNKVNHVIKNRETNNGSDVPYEAKSRAHEHLKSNIFFFDN